jgi:hypothetical protein
LPVTVWVIAWPLQALFRRFYPLRFPIASRWYNKLNVTCRSTTPTLDPR